jgi:hypothetical protein
MWEVMAIVLWVILIILCFVYPYWSTKKAILEEDLMIEERIKQAHIRAKLQHLKNCNRGV